MYNLSCGVFFELYQLNSSGPQQSSSGAKKRVY
nr:MAG TPA: hypothetical protein [Caudoviricetes sp.]